MTSKKSQKINPMIMLLSFLLFFGGLWGGFFFGQIFMNTWAAVPTIITACITSLFGLGFFLFEITRE